MQQYIHSRPMGVWTTGVRTPAGVRKLFSLPISSCLSPMAIGSPPGEKRMFVPLALLPARRTVQLILDEAAMASGALADGSREVAVERHGDAPSMCFVGIPCDVVAEFRQHHQVGLVRGGGIYHA